MRWQNVPWLVILPQMVFATVGLLVAYWLTHFVPEWGTLLYIFCPLTFLLLFNGTWWYLKARPERGRLHRERAGLAPSDRPIITHTGPPMFQGQYQVRWIRTPFESLGAAILIIVLSLGALIGT